MTGLELVVIGSIPIVDNLLVYAYIPAHVLIHMCGFTPILTQISDYVFGGEINMTLFVTPIMLIAVVIETWQLRTTIIVGENS